MIALSAGSPPWWKANIAMTNPGVQKPHWVASVSIIACCTGCSVPSGAARPSTVSTAQLSICGSIIRQEFTAWNCSDPSTGRPRTMVQAPQSPSAQPSLVPVRCARVRSQSSTVMVGGAPSSLHGLPFNRNRIAVMARAHTMSYAVTPTTTDTPRNVPCKPRTRPASLRSGEPAHRAA
jgi:hypothetical protein